ncbi:MAG TPA: phage protein Gp36 family protein [Myxococcales bacterium]|nr:phage protein Gp36 family protein [Myxococcales bacterium]
MPATPYATLTDLGNSVNAAALAAVSTTVQQVALQRAADEMEGYLKTQFTVPLVSWQTDVTECNCALAVYKCLRQRGWNPKANPQIKEDYDRWMEWLKAIGRNEVHPAGIVDSSVNQKTANEGASGFSFSSRSPQNRRQTASDGQTRGW